ERIQALGGSVCFSYDLIPAIAGTLPAAAVDALRAHPNVRFVEPDQPLFADLTPNHPQFTSLWGLNNTGQTGGTNDSDIDAPEAWNLTTGSSSTLVAVIDTGSQGAARGILPPPNIGCPGTSQTHPDLAANVWTNPGEGP